MLKNKIIILTGGSGLLGQEFSKSIADKGGNVIVADINKNIDDDFQKIIDNNDNIEFYHLDVTLKESINDIIAYASKKYQKIDAWINNAYPKTKENLTKNREYSDEFLEMDYHTFCNSIKLNLGSIFISSQLISKYFINQGYGNIINISSIYGVISPRFEIYKDTKMTMPIDYAVNKSALIQFTKYLAKYFKGKNIRVNSLSPGGILNNQPKSFIENYKRFSLNDSMLNKEDLSGALLFLLSDSSSSINGQNIIIDDGWTL